MKNVLVLGSGFVSRPLVRYLLKLDGVSVTVASQESDRAKALVEEANNGKALFLDVNDEASLGELVSTHDVTVSLLPYTFHVRVAKQCLKFKKNMVTTSYVSPEMRALDDEAKQAGVILLNEIGLDPGIDHMSAMKIFDHVHNHGGKVVSFESYCGGLPAPDNADNPFGYKFSWSPKGVLKAGKNAARFRKTGNLVEIDGKNLFENHWPMEIEGLEANLEGYPNRDSLSYIDLYDLKHVETMFRGTLRFAGWCNILRKFADLGMLDEETSDRFKGLTYAQFMGEMIGNRSAADIRNAIAAHLGLASDSREIEAMEWLGLFSDEKVPETVPSAPIDILTDVMERRMAYKEGERDMVVLHHRFVAEFPCCTRKITSTMVDYGIPGGDTSMARTVSLPCAIAVRMILEGRLTKTGVHIPVTPDIYMPVLNELESMKICFVETEHMEKKSVSC